MPGIVGIVSRKPAAQCQRLVAAMVGSMMHEPFYESGTCCLPDVGVYAGWIAHPASFAQRESRGDGRQDVVVAMAGDCVADGGWPRVADLYRESGDGFVTRLNGLFSGLLIDRRRSRALLFNDRFGLERIYYHETSDACYFASEAKALLRVLPELRAFDDAGVRQFLTFGSTQGRTLFRGIGLCEGGSLWSFERGQHRKQRYFVPAQWESQPPLSAEEFEERLGETFTSVLPRYVGSGEGIGISLTGGLDTRMIMACLPDMPHKPVCYTFSGKEGETLDERLAARVAREFGLEHHVLRVGNGFLSAYGRHVDKNVFVTDACSGATGAHELYLNAQARTLAPVRVTGNFGSEVLRGMSTFKPLGLSPELFRRGFVSDVAASVPTTDAAVHPVTFAAFREIPWNLIPNVAAGRSQVTFRTPFLDNDVVALAFRAPRASRQSPELALRFVRRHHPGLARIPTDRGLIAGDRGFTRALRRLFAEVTFKADYVHKEGLPRSLSSLQPLIGRLSKVRLLGHHKYLAYRLWFRNELASHVMEVLTDPRTSRSPYWNAPWLESMAEDHLRGRRNWVREISAVLTLEAAERLLLRGVDDPPLERDDASFHGVPAVR
jgi:asparagine synthase (glutamine-hydrolysing)